MRALPFPVEKAAALLRESSTLATPLLLICLSAYGDEVFGDHEKGIEPMDPVELFVRLEEDFRAELPEAVENRINAIYFALSTDAFYEDPLAFMSVAASLADGDIGDMPDGMMEELTLPEALWAIYEVGLNRDDDMALAPIVLKEIDEITRGEAAEPNEDGSAHFESFIREQKLDLASQLAVLGAKLSLSELSS